MTNGGGEVEVCIRRAQHQVITSFRTQLWAGHSPCQLTPAMVADRPLKASGPSSLEGLNVCREEGLGGGGVQAGAGAGGATTD